VAKQERQDSEQRAPVFDGTWAADAHAGEESELARLRAECARLHAENAALAGRAASHIDSEEKYRALFASIDEAFCILGDFRFDADGRCLDFRYLETNPAYERETGRSGVQGKTWREIASEDERGLPELLGRVVLEGRPVRRERWSEPFHGWYDVHAFRIDAGRGEVGMLFTNISERKRVELSLRESRERKAFLLALEDTLRVLDTPRAVELAASKALRTRLGASAVVFWEAGSDGRLMPGMARQAVPGYQARLPVLTETGEIAPWNRLRAGHSLVSEDAATDERLAHAGAAALVGAARGWAALPLARDERLCRLLTVEYCAPHAWSQHELALLHEVAGRTWAALERARAEQSLQASERKYRSLFDSIDEGFALVEMLDGGDGGIRDYRLLEVNRAFARQAGVADAAGRRALELLPRLDPGLVARFAAVASSGVPARFECRIGPTAGRWYSVYASPIGPPDSRQVAIVFDDISARKHAERVLRQRERRQAFLLRVSDALRSAASADDAMAAGARLLGVQLEAALVVVGEFQGDEVVLHTGYRGPDGSAAVVEGRYPRGALGPCWNVFCARGAPLVIGDVAGDARLEPRERERLAAAGVAALAAVPVMVDGAAAAVFAVQARAAREWSEDDVELVREVAERTWVVVERARAEAALRHSEAHLRRMLQIPTVGIIHFDMVGGITQANDAFLDIVGYTREELEAGRVRYEELTPPEWRWRDLQTLAELGTHGRSVPFEKEYFRRDGERIWILCAGMMIDGHTAVEFIIDVTERRRTQELLAASEQRYRAFTSLAPLLMWQADPSGRHVELNARWLEYTGQSAGETQDSGWLDAIHPDEAPASAAAFEAAYASGAALELEHRVRGADGGYRWFLVRNQPVYDEDSGQLVGWCGVAMDIDARKRAEAAQQESEARFRALADAAPALIWQIGPDARLAYVNRRYAEITGIGTESLLPDGWRSAVHADDLPYFMAAAADGLADRAAFHLRLRVRSSCGQWRWFETHFAPWFAHGGDYRGHVGIGIDITDSVQAEQALQEADRRKDEFLAVLAHELRNPLAPISNAVQMLRCADGKRKADRVMEMANRQVRQITRLVDDLMDVSRITRGKIELARQPVPLGEIVAGAVETSRPAIDRAGHAFTLSLPPEPLMLDADKVRLTQVFSNLLNNAAKYTDPHGRIMLSAWREDAPDGARVKVAVRDSGIGIPRDKLTRVFDMFAQVEAAGSRSQGGLGIGLAMVHSLVQMHGGTVEAHSEGPGRGSEFVVRLPLLATEAAPQEAPRPAAAGAGVLAGCRVLVVDDNRDAADSLCMLLGARGAEAECAYDGRQALAMLERAQPDALVLDIGMPGMDGYQVARAVREGGRYPGLRIIALTGWGQEADRQRSRECGIDHHLTKPVDLAALERLLVRSGRETEAG
jgi:PAS domain S-box-containing protein